jgi:hypothetical protein
MHTASTAHEALDFLWNNYLGLSEQVDLEVMPPENIDTLIRQNAPVRPFRIATWLARQGYFIAAWSLWEYYARGFCQRLPNKETKRANESTVEWVGRSLAANNVSFNDMEWFVRANCLRNLIAHNGARVDDPRTEKLLERCRKAFADIETWQDGYIDITHSHLADLQIKIEDFIRDT